MNPKRTALPIAAALAAMLTACSSGEPAPTGDAAASATPATASSAETTQVTGTLTYRERMLLKPGSVVEVWLLDTSLADAAAIELAYQRIDNPGPPPLSYVLDYDPADIDERMSYSVRAQIKQGGKLIYTTDTHYPVLTRGGGNEIDLELVRVADSSARTERPPKPDSSLSNTYWKLTSIDGEAVRHEGEGREPHLKLLTQDMKTAGSTGCNTFTGSYETYASSLRFGMLATTRMACASGMDIERRFLEALERVDRYDINGESMTLYAGDTAVLGFAAIYF